MSLIEQVCCVSVKILCENKDKTDSSVGTGTIISDGDSYYVMTAGHCIKNSHDIVFDIDDIKINYRVMLEELYNKAGLF